MAGHDTVARAQVIQGYLPSGRNPVLGQQRDLAALLSTVGFRTRMVDNLAEMFIEASDLPHFCFYGKFIEGGFQVCLEF